MAIELLFAQFVVVERVDPITLDTGLVYAIEQDRNVMAIGCRKIGNGNLFVEVLPDRYYGAVSAGLLFKPKTIHRFKLATKAKSDQWFFAEKSISYSPTPIFGTIKKTARFLDQLAKDTQFSLRYQSTPSHSETVTFQYNVDADLLASVIERCKPKRLIKYLNDMDSVLKPQKPADQLE